MVERPETVQAIPCPHYGKSTPTRKTHRHVAHQHQSNEASETCPPLSTTRSLQRTSSQRRLSRWLEIFSAVVIVSIRRRPQPAGLSPAALRPHALPSFLRLRRLGARPFPGRTWAPMGNARPDQARQAASMGSRRQRRTICSNQGIPHIALSA